MRRGTKKAGGKTRNSTNAPKPETAQYTAERLALRVFVKAPRTFSFSHRKPTSLRHPYLPLLVQLADEANMPPNARVGFVLEALLNGKSEIEKWDRVAAVFDIKMNSPELEKARLALLVAPDVMARVEAMWSRIGGSQGSFLSNDVYRQLHGQLYPILTGCDDVSLTAATLAAVNEDYAYDARDLAGASFGSFGLSLLEIADNWVPSRNPADYAAFLQRLLDGLGLVPRKGGPAPVSTTDFCLSSNVFYSGGVLVKHHNGDDVNYSKAPM